MSGSLDVCRAGSNDLSGPSRSQADPDRAREKEGETDPQGRLQMMESHKVLELLSSYKSQGIEFGVKRFLETEDLLWSFKIESVDKLGLLLSELGVEAKTTPKHSLAKQAELLSRKVTYLDEGFKLVERDVPQQTLILRSVAPQQRDEKSSYFEILLVRGNSLALSHYKFDRVSGRRQVSPSNLSMETFERLLEDLESVLR
jgi:hypothetical protein